MKRKQSVYPVSASRHFSRRSFLVATTSLAAAAVWSSRAIGVTKKNVNVPDQLFTLGVASGDPTPEGFVIWTRLAPRPLEGGGMPAENVEVAWEVSEDEPMTKVVRSGKTVATPDWAHSVHVEVDGLAPDRWYFYRFHANGEDTGKGRARTMPAAGASPKRLHFAFASCQHYENGYFTAYEHMAKEGNDLIVHLGDYIYEGAGRDNQLRKHVGPLLQTLDDYRNRHAQYKTDPMLQAAHAAAPWIVTWDDHEFANNCAGFISEKPTDDPAEYRQRRAHAYQAYYEHMPLRRTSLPKGPDMQLYRRIAFGNLAEFFVLDTRQYRSDQPCGDGNRPQCPECFDPKATALGEAQEKWLVSGLGESKKRWNVLAQQIMMARVDRTAGEVANFSMDQWPGYEMNRRRLLKFFYDRPQLNPVVLGGDIHTNWANNLIADFDNLESRIVASEFVGTSISSGGDGINEPKRLSDLYAENPFVKFHNAQRGYVRCTVSPREWRSDFQVVEYVTRPDAPLITRASFVVEDGKPGVVTA
jgi:alkaline phosphatase D